MKKSLILSIVMTLVLVISMSTATFAWYTANSTATATVGTITADTAGGDISVDIISLNGEAVTIDAGYKVSAESNKAISPAAPLEAISTYTAATTTDEWETGSIGINADGITEEFNSTVVTGTADLYFGEIAITNSSTTNVEVTVSATPADNVGSLKVIIFDENNVILFGSAYNTGADENGDPEDSVDAVAAGTNKVTLGKATKYIKFIAWFEGYEMENADMGKTASIAFNFSAAPVQA